MKTKNILTFKNFPIYGGTVLTNKCNAASAITNSTSFNNVLACDGSTRTLYVRHRLFISHGMCGLSIKGDVMPNRKLKENIFS